MPIKAMIFVDGTWLYKTTPKLREKFGDESLTIDYGKLPEIIRKYLSDKLNLPEQEIDVVRTNIFASIPSNLHPEDEEKIKQQKNFYEILKERHLFETFIHELSYYTPYDQKQHRLRYESRQEDQDEWVPQEKCVDIDLATTMLYFAAIPHAYDIAVLVAGDEDYKPALKRVRRLGKRVLIAGVRGSTSRIYLDPQDQEKIKDFQTILLDEYIDKLELKSKKTLQKCFSCNRDFYTSYQPSSGEKVYCDKCREEYKKKQQ